MYWQQPAFLTQPSVGSAWFVEKYNECTDNKTYPLYIRLPCFNWIIYWTINCTLFRVWLVMWLILRWHFCIKIYTALERLAFQKTWCSVFLLFFIPKIQYFHKTKAKHFVIYNVIIQTVIHHKHLVYLLPSFVSSTKISPVLYVSSPAAGVLLWDLHG